VSEIDDSRILLTRVEVARMFGVSKGVVNKLAREGKISEIRVGKKTPRYHKQDIERYLREWQPPIQHPVWEDINGDSRTKTSVG